MIIGVLALSACSDDAETAPPEPGDEQSATQESDETTTTGPDEPAVTTTVADAATTSTDATAPDATAPDATTPAGGGFDEIDTTLADLVDQNGLSGAGLVLVDRDDGIVHESYAGEFSADRVSLIASSSKMISAGVLLHLADEGLLDIDAPLADLVDWAGDGADITVAQMLSNSSGLVGLGPDPAYQPYLCQFIPGDEIENCAASALATDGDDDDVIPPDTAFRYGGMQWQIAGAVAEAVSGRTWAELIEEIYVEPCGVDSLGYTNHWFELGEDHPDRFDPSSRTPTENPQIEGGGYITAPDYAELLLMILRDGTCGDEQVLSATALESMLSDRVGETYGDAGDPATGYGMGWWVERDTPYVHDAGLYGARPWLDLEDGYGAYLVVEADGSVGGRFYEELRPLVDSAMTS